MFVKTDTGLRVCGVPHFVILMNFFSSQYCICGAPFKTFEPASFPTTRMSVSVDTEEVTLAPAAFAIVFASPRVIVKAPVKQRVFAGQLLLSRYRRRFHGRLHDGLHGRCLGLWLSLRLGTGALSGLHPWRHPGDFCLACHVVAFLFPWTPVSSPRRLWQPQSLCAPSY